MLRFTQVAQAQELTSGKRLKALRPLLLKLAEQAQNYADPAGQVQAQHYGLDVFELSHLLRAGYDGRLSTTATKVAGDDKTKPEVELAPFPLEAGGAPVGWTFRVQVVNADVLKAQLEAAGDPDAERVDLTPSVWAPDYTSEVWKTSDQKAEEFVARHGKGSPLVEAKMPAYMLVVCQPLDPSHIIDPDVVEQEEEGEEVA